MHTFWIDIDKPKSCQKTIKILSSFPDFNCKIEFFFAKVKLKYCSRWNSTLQSIKNYISLFEPYKDYLYHLLQWTFGEPFVQNKNWYHVCIARKISLERVGVGWGLNRGSIGAVLNGSHDGVGWSFTGDPFWVWLGVHLGVWLGIRGPWGCFTLITIYIGIVCTAKQFLTKGERKLILTYRW